MEQKIEATREFGLEKGYLQEKVIWLRPIPDRSMTLMTKDPRNSIHSFMYEGAVLEWPVPLNERLDVMDPFKGNSEERKYFEAMLSLNLGTAKTPDCYWLKPEAKVVIKKEASIMSTGVRFDMSNPEDVLRVKILRMQREVAPDWNSKDIPHYKWVLIDEEVVDTSKKKVTDMTVKVWSHYGGISENK